MSAAAQYAATSPECALPGLSQPEFERLRRLIYSTAGITLPPPKRVMVETRLRKRLQELRLPSFRAYCDLLEGPEGRREFAPLLDRITTNKTDFFREAVHFEFLTGRALPALAAEYGSGRRAPLALWSAGCSSGEEPYSLAMILSEYAAAPANRGYRFSIQATDISTRVLEMARAAIYSAESVEPIPTDIRRKYLLKGREPAAGRVRIVPELRSLVTFRRLNLMDAEFGFDRPFDVIFCRNVMIYFDKRTQESLVRRFGLCLRPQGYLFIGHSETLNGLDAPFSPAAPAVYRRVA